jgi:pimeloyl-ACP methyl ester carboxylesterase
MALVEVPGGILEVSSAGSGPDLVLLHSLLIDRSAFALVAPELAGSHRVHLVALPGFDRSTPVEASIEAYADRVAAAMKAMGLGPDTAVLGNGFGGFVAIALAIRHGKLFDRLLLIDTAAGFPEAGKVAFRTMADRIAAGGMEAIVDIAARRIFHDAYLEAHPQAFDERRAVLRRFNPDAFIAACRVLEKVDLRRDLAAIANPTLVLLGELDAATPRALATELARDIPGAVFIELPQCGPCPPLEQPKAFLEAITPFLAGK